jgi:hypothetical protein
MAGYFLAIHKIFLSLSCEVLEEAVGPDRR